MDDSEGVALVGGLSPNGRFELVEEAHQNLAPTFGALLRWWLKTYSAKSPSHDRNRSTIEKHFLGAEIAELRLQEVPPAVVEMFLEGKAGELAPQTVNHLRRFVLTAFNGARRAGRWAGLNPRRAEAAPRAEAQG